MAGLGLGGAYAVDAMQQAVRQRIADQIAAKQRQDVASQREFENQLNTRKVASQEADQAAQAAERMAAANAPEKPVVINGHLVKASTGEEIGNYPAAAPTTGFNLGPGQHHFENGKDIASVPPNPAAPEKAPTPSYQLQPELDGQGKQTGRFLGYNTHTNSWEPVKGDAPNATKAAPGAAQLAVKDENKKHAQTVLTSLDGDINEAEQKNALGPISGRISDIEQNLGNADPIVSRLATRMTAAKMLVDAGIGGMRAAASPGLMARWDKVLAAPLNAANLREAVQVMREMVGTETPAAATAKSGVTVKSIRQLP